MEGNYLTAGDLALLEQKRGIYDGDEYRSRGCRGTAATGLALGASALGIAIFGGIALWGGLNSASKARYDGATNTMNAQAKANSDLVALLANRIVADNQRADNITLDVNNKLYALQGATANATGGSATSQALATAEALALLNGSSSANPLSNVIQQNCALRVTRVAEQNCGCGCNG
jgi:hypothetical protein